MSIKKLPRIIFVAFLLVFGNGVKVFAYSDIQLEGLSRLSKDSVTTNLLYNEKEKITEAELSDEVKNLYNTGFFNDIKASYENGKLVLTLTEVPIISAVKFNGLKQFSKENIEKELLTKERTFYSKSNAITDAKKIETIYKTLGILDVSVQPMIEFLEGGKIYVIFNIIEGKQRKIRKILIEGNNVFSDYTLKNEIPFKENKFFRFFSSSTGYNLSETVSGIEKIKRFYGEKGYAKMEIKHNIVSINNTNDVDVNIFLEEGKKYNFGNAKIINNIPSLDAFRNGSTEGVLEFKEGKRYNISLIDQTKYNISKILQTNGFLSSEVKIEYEFDEIQNIVNLKFVINQTKRIYVGKINFFGNLKTHDKVLRREFILAEGDTYDVEKIRRSIQRIRNTGYFGDVQIKENAVSEDRIDLNIFVAEGKTISTEISFGYDFGSEFSLMLGLTESNFRGTGLGVGINFEKGRYNSSVQLSLTEPYLLDRDIALITAIGYTEQDNKNLNTYKSSSFFLNVRGVYSLAEFLKHSVFYSIRADNLQIIDTFSFAISNPLIFEQEGDFITSSIGHSLVLDKRDNGFLPNSGFLIQGTESIAGIGGDIKYIQHEISGEQYFPIFGIDNSVLGFRLKAANIKGYGGDGVNIKDRYNLGSRNGLRGFDFSGVGPKFAFTSALSGTTENFNFGGKNLFLGNVEYRFPNFLPEEFGFSTFAFYDFGTVFGAESVNTKTVFGSYEVLDSKSIRMSAGVGVSWRSPIGIIGFSYAKPLKSEPYDITRRFNLSIGGFNF
jgi:outer membrane protein insertion porin family